MRIFLAVCFFVIVSYQQIFAQVKIRWDEDQLLTWSNFEAKPVKNSPMAAQTYTRTEFGMSFQDGKFQWVVDCYFSPDNSWVKPELKSEDLLDHEQLHFDIAELYARKIRKNMDALVLNSIKDSKKLEKTFQDGLNDLAQTQKEYDKETDHGIIEDAQKKWVQKVRSELKSFRAYASSNYIFD